MVGPAFTLRYIPAREDRNQLTEFRNPAHPQRVAVETCPPGHVLAMDSRKDPRAASAGDILVTRLMVRGVAGVVTDGGFRDAATIGELDIPVYHIRPSSPTKLTLHEAHDLNISIGCGDVAVFPGDIIVGDADCVIVILQVIAGEVAEEAFEMTVYEDFLIEKVKAGTPIIGLYPRTQEHFIEEFSIWRQREQRRGHGSARMAPALALRESARRRQQTGRHPRPIRRWRAARRALRAKWDADRRQPCR